MTTELIDRLSIVEAEITLRGEALGLINDLKRIRSKEGCEIRLILKVKYSSSYFPDTFNLPIIKDGNAVNAKESLQKVFNQRAISANQFEKIALLIEEAEYVTKQ